jgi:hypothetical protein
VNRKEGESCPPRKILKSNELDHGIKGQSSIILSNNDLTLDMEKTRKLYPS